MQTDQDELYRYLKADTVRQVDDPIAWWVENKVLYPRFYRMALDFLTVSGEWLS